MSISAYQSHKRFAVRQTAHVHGELKRPVTGLLIELSLDGCRIGKVDDAKFTHGQAASILVDGFEAIEGYVRWAKDGCVGLRFVRPLHTARLGQLLDACRNPSTIATA